MLETDFVQFLLADGGVTALVGQQVNLAAPPRGNRADRIVIHRVAGAEGQTYLGRDGLEWALLQVDCWSSSWLKAKTIARAVIERCGGASAPLHRIVVESERSGFDAGDGAPGASTPSDYFRSSLDIRVWRHRA